MSADPKWVQKLRDERANPTPDHPPKKLTKAQAEQEARIAAHIKMVVDAAPPFTPEQRDRLALLLRPESRA